MLTSWRRQIDEISMLCEVCKSPHVVGSGGKHLRALRFSYGAVPHGNPHHTSTIQFILLRRGGLLEL
jgi:hypothetical protein